MQLGDGSCTISVSGSGADRTITATATIAGPPQYQKAIEADIKRTGNSINILT